MEAVRQGVKQESADELVRRELAGIAIKLKIFGGSP